MVAVEVPLISIPLFVFRAFPLSKCERISCFPRSLYSTFVILPAFLCKYFPTFSAVSLRIKFIPIVPGDFGHQGNHLSLRTLPPDSFPYTLQFLILINVITGSTHLYEGRPPLICNSFPFFDRSDGAFLDDISFVCRYASNVYQNLL